jgi:hypothetical protein
VRPSRANAAVFWSRHRRATGKRGRPALKGTRLGSLAATAVFKSGTIWGPAATPSRSSRLREGEVRGFCAVVAPSRDENAGERTAEVAATYVYPQAWRFGLDTALLGSALSSHSRRSGGSSGCPASQGGGGGYLELVAALGRVGVDMHLPLGDTARTHFGAAGSRAAR